MGNGYTTAKNTTGTHPTIKRNKMKKQYTYHEIEEIHNRLAWATTAIKQYNKHEQSKELNEAVYEIEKVLEIIEEK